MKICAMSLTLLAAITIGCSRIHKIDNAIEPVLITDLDDMEGEYVKKLNGKGLLVKFDKGDVIPVEIISQLPFASLESGENRLCFSQTTYIFLSKDGAFVSPDGQRFAAVYDGKAVKKLYGAKKGSLSIGFAISKESGARIKAGMSLE